MAVIYADPNTRWSSLGTALGNVIGDVAGVYAAKQLNAGVAAITQDPSVPADQKYTTIMSKYGQAGANLYLNTLKSQLVQQQISSAGTAQELTKAQITNTNANLPSIMAEGKIKSAEAGIADPLAQADLAVKQLQAPFVQSQTGEANARAQLTQAEVPETQARTQLEQAAVTLAQQKAKMASSMQANGSIDDYVKNELPDATQEEIMRVRRGMALDPDDPFKGAQTQLDKIQGERKTLETQANAARIRAAEPKPLDTERQKIATTSAALGSSTEDFVNSLEKDPQTGLLTGAPLEAWWAAKGGDSQNTNLLTMYEQQKQMIAEAAKGQSQFLSAQGIHLAGSIVPSLSHTPIPNLVAVHSMAVRQLAMIDSNLKGASSNEQRQPLEDEKTRWTKIAERTDLTNSYTTADGNSVLIKGRDQVDATTLKPVFQSDKSYKFGSTTFSGAQILDYARQVKQSPQAVEAALKAKYGEAGAGNQ